MDRFLTSVPVCLSPRLSVCLFASLSFSASQIHLVYSHKYSLYCHAIINAMATSGNQISYKSQIVGQAQTATGSTEEPPPVRTLQEFASLNHIYHKILQLWLTWRMSLMEIPESPLRAWTSDLILTGWQVWTQPWCEKLEVCWSQSHTEASLKATLWMGFRKETWDDVAQERNSSITGAIFKVPVFALFQWAVLILRYVIGVCNLGLPHYYRNVTFGFVQ